MRNGILGNFTLLLSVFMCAAGPTNAWRAINVEAAFGYYLPFYFFSGYIANLLSVLSWQVNIYNFVKPKFNTDSFRFPVVIKR
jgi:hypothetical protein